MSTILIQNAHVVYNGKVEKTDVLIEGEYIVAIGQNLIKNAEKTIDAQGLHLFPGVIDGQVHFRDPGLTHKADMYTESKAALAGGVTSFIDMPNTKPNVLSRDILDAKYALGAEKSLANFGFFLGVNASNIDDVLAMDTSDLLAVSDDGLYFSDAGNILADRPEMLEKLLAGCPAVVAIHSELESVVHANEEEYRAKYGDDVPVKYHPIIRSEKACFDATKRAIELANKHNARLHILHLTTAAETALFRNDVPMSEKNITTEVSVHHLWFNDGDYERLGKRIKWNPAIKTKQDQEGLLAALVDNRIDFVTTDHAPHAAEEKDQPYFKSMSGAPMIQHSLNVMLEFYHQGKISLEKIAEKMCHNPAAFYGMAKRGKIQEGYKADLTLVDLHKPWTVAKDNLLYKCGWSPCEGNTFQSKVLHTWVNGHHAYQNGRFDESQKGQALKRS